MAVKDDRRARVMNIMGGGDSTPAPKVDKEKFIPTQPSGGARISSKQVHTLKVVNVKLGEVSTQLKGSLVLDKMRAELKRRKAQKAKRAAREKAIEAKKGGDPKKKDKKSGGGLGIFDKILNFLINFTLGAIAMKLVDIADNPDFQSFLKGLTVALSWIGKIAGGLFIAFANLVDWGYKIVDGATNWVKGAFGEEAAEKFTTFMGNLKNLINGFIVWKLVFEKIFKAIVKNVTRIFKGISKLIRTIWVKVRRLMGRKLRMFFKNLAKRTGELAKNLGKNVLQKGGKLLKSAGGFMKGIGGKILGKGGGKVGGLVGKIFGKAAKFIGPAIKGAMPAVKGFFGRIPILGPLIVGIVSLMSGEPPGQALFKSIGAALGGALGTFIPVPILGTLLGEAVGVFVGDLMYHLIIKRDPKAAMKLFGDTMKGIFNAGKAIVNWIFGGGLFNLLKQGGALYMKFAKWIFFTAIPWATKKVSGIGKIIGEWLTSGMARWVDTFPSFDIPNVGIQDMIYSIFDMRWPDFWPFGGRLSLGIGGKPVLPFLNEWRPDFLENLPRLPRILGFLWQGMPLLKNLVDGDGEVKSLPKIWNLFNPMFMIPHTKNAFFPGTGGGSSADVSAAGGGGSDDAKDVSEKASYEKNGGEGTTKIIEVPIPVKKIASVSSSGGSGGSGGSSRELDPQTASAYAGK